MARVKTSRKMKDYSLVTHVNNPHLCPIHALAVHVISLLTPQNEEGITLYVWFILFYIFQY